MSFDDVTKMANIDIQESIKYKEIQSNNHQLKPVKSGIIHGQQIFETLQAISPRKKVVRSFQDNDLDDDQDEYFYQRLSPYLNSK